MRFAIEIGRGREARSIENPNVPVSAAYADILGFFGLSDVDLPRVTVDRALTVPAVSCAVTFLSRTMAAIPLHAFKAGEQREDGDVEEMMNKRPNPTMGSYKFRNYLWQQVFTGGRGLAYIERKGAAPDTLWPMVPSKTAIKRVGFRLVYQYEGKEYGAEDVIDVPYMLKPDQTGHYSPITLAAKAIQLALAMNDYGSKFFAGGGVPPLALSGPLPEGAPAMKRAADDIDRAIKFAQQNQSPVLPIPAGHKLEGVGFDPSKSQMTEARRFQIEEIARAYQLPPLFLQDLSRATLNNAEQQDLFLVKHLIGQWAKAFEDELNLKLFGGEGEIYVEHNLNGLLRGDLKSRIEALARGIQTAQLTPNEARKIEGRPAHKNPVAEELLVQGATIPLGQKPEAPKPPAQGELDLAPAEEGEEDGERNDPGN